MHAASRLDNSSQGSGLFISPSRAASDYKLGLKTAPFLKKFFQGAFKAI
jgi:hypothetical protein